MIDKAESEYKFDKTICLLLTLDTNRKYYDDKTGTYKWHYYEQEAIRCVDAWRMNGGWLADISIYGIYTETTKPTKSLLDILEKKYNVKCIQTDNIFKNRDTFLNTIVTQKYFYDHLTEDCYIHLDLDMTLRKEMPVDLFSKCGFFCEYTKDESYSSAELEYRYNKVVEQCGGVCHNTFFIFGHRRINFIDDIINSIWSPYYEDFFSEKIYYIRNDDRYFYEEGLYDYLYINCMLAGYDVIPGKYLTDNFFTHSHLTVKDFFMNFDIYDNHKSKI